MKDRNKILDNIISNVLEIMPPSSDTLKVTLEAPEINQILELEIKLNIRDYKKENNKNGKIKYKH